MITRARVIEEETKELGENLSAALQAVKWSIRE